MDLIPTMGVGSFFVEVSGFRLVSARTPALLGDKQKLLLLNAPDENCSC
ncbi:hypothetical protein BSG1_12441 [Bacillus sp. SG-1]|nr:hypothetical protein BSG1_12441 [Bacillus sp. SG-1]